MNRRAFVARALALGCASRVAGVLAQSAAARVPQVGYLGPSPETAPALLPAFVEGLAARGYERGRNVVIVERWTNAGTRMRDAVTLLAYARELVAVPVDVIAASIDPAILAASKATHEVPIVMLNVSDPIALGLVPSLSHPGGNITGLTRLSPELVGKNLQTLLEVVPTARRIGLLVSASPRAPASTVGHALDAAAKRGVALQVVEVAGEDLDAAFAALKRRGAQGLLVADTGGGVFFTERERLVALALAQRLPAIYANTEIVEAGGLMSYSPPAPENYRRAGAFIDRILRGAKPGDLPIEQPTTFELAVNLRTAAAMGITIPPSLMLRVDRKIPP